MAFRVEFAKKAVNDLRNLDYASASLLIGWMKKNLANCYNPRAFGKEMAKFHYNNWKYRIGSYRLLSYIDKERIVILSIEKSHHDLIQQLNQITTRNSSDQP